MGTDEWPVLGSLQSEKKGWVAGWGQGPTGGWRAPSPTHLGHLPPSAPGACPCVPGAGWAREHPGGQPGALGLTRMGCPGLREGKCLREQGLNPQPAG